MRYCVVCERTRWYGPTGSYDESKSPRPVDACFFFWWYGDPRDLHSFPTRRSSDLFLFLAFPSFPLDSRQQKVIFMNGGGGHEELVTWMLSEAKRGMLLHCCCFVVNSEGGYIAVRLLDTFDNSRQVTSNHYWKATSKVVRILGRISALTRWGNIFFWEVFFSWEDMSTFLSKLLMLRDRL